MGIVNCQTVGKFRRHFRIEKLGSRPLYDERGPLTVVPKYISTYDDALRSRGGQFISHVKTCRNLYDGRTPSSRRAIGASFLRVVAHRGLPHHNATSRLASN
jgi:hypothetical protein